MSDQKKTEAPEIDVRALTEQIKSKVAAELKEEIKAENSKRLAELKEAFPDDSAFAAEQFAAGMSVLEAKAAYADKLAEKIKQVESEKQKNTSAIGSEPVAAGDDPQAGSDDVDQFWAEVDAYAEEKDLSRAKAMKVVMKKRPQLYAQWRQSVGQVRISKN